MQKTNVLQFRLRECAWCVLPIVRLGKTIRAYFDDGSEENIYLCDYCTRTLEDKWKRRAAKEVA